MRFSDSIRRWIGAASTLVVVLFISCHSYVVDHTAPTAVPSTPTERTYRVTMVDGTRILLYYVSVASDTLSGTTTGRVQEVVRIPLPQVREVAERHFNGYKLGGLILGIAAAAFGVLVITVVIVCSNSNCDFE